MKERTWSASIVKPLNLILIYLSKPNTNNFSFKKRFIYYLKFSLINPNYIRQVPIRHRIKPAKLPFQSLSVERYKQNNFLNLSFIHQSSSFCLKIKTLILSFSTIFHICDRLIDGFWIVGPGKFGLQGVRFRVG